MKTIICLGAKACDIGETYEISSDAPYIIKLIDKDIEGENCFSIAPQNSPEEYERNTPDLAKFLSDIGDEVMFFLSGECEVANCALAILQQIKTKKISIVYLVPQLDFLTYTQKIQERVIRNVLQEYTRSGVFENIILLDSTLIESIMGETSIKNFDVQFNLTVKSLLRTHISIKTGEPIIDNSNKPKDASRIMTFAYYNSLNDSENSMYNMLSIDDKVYHFFLTEETLNGDSKVLRSIKDKLKSKVVDNTKVSYTINSTSADADFCFVVYCSKAIQP